MSGTSFHFPHILVHCTTTCKIGLEIGSIYFHESVITRAIYSYTYIRRQGRIQDFVQGGGDRFSDNLDFFNIEPKGGYF